MRQILGEQQKDLGDGRQFVKTLVPCPISGHPYWVYTTRKFVPSHADVGGGVFVNDPTGFAHSGSPSERFQRAAAQIQARPLDLNPSLTQEAAEWADFRSRYPRLAERLAVAVAYAAAAADTGKARAKADVGKAPLFDLGDVQVSMSVCREAPRGLGLREDEIAEYLSRFQHGDLGDYGAIVPFDDLDAEAQFNPVANPATEASSAVKFKNGLVVGKYSAWTPERSVRAQYVDQSNGSHYSGSSLGTRPDDFVLIGTLILGDVARTLVLAGRDSVSF